MAIQFGCASCGKPIEVDDEFALQAVTCPYCRAVVKAPSAGLAGGPPMAAPVPPMPGGVRPEVMGYSPAAPPLPNRFATAGLMFAIVILLCLCVSMGSLFSEVQKKFPDGKVNQSQMQEVMQEAVKKPMFMACSWTIVTAAVIGLILSILGLTRRQGRKWQAVVGVTICGLSVTCIGLSFLGTLMQLGKH